MLWNGFSERHSSCSSKQHKHTIHTTRQRQAIKGRSRESMLGIGSRRNRFSSLPVVGY